eukprot:529775_1
MVVTKYDKYIYDSFDCFVLNKKQIILDLDTLYDEKKKGNKMMDLIMNKMEENDMILETPNFRNDTDDTNFPDKQIFGVFKNVKKLIIKSTRADGYYCYTYSLILLLSLIESTSVEKVIVKAVVWNNSWLSLLWKRS